MRTPEELADWAATRRTPAARLIARIQGKHPGLGASEVALLPGIDGEAMLRVLADRIATDAQFARAPCWNGHPAETGPLARMHGHPLVAALLGRHGRSACARLVARLAELCAFASGASAPIGRIDLGNGSGVGWVETSRGLLLHYAEIAAGRVGAYVIVAPTEWNFHPQGALPRGLEGRDFAGEDAVREAVGLLVQSLDPCVPWQAEVVLEGVEPAGARHA